MEKHVLEGSKVWFDEDIYTFSGEIESENTNESKYLYTSGEDLYLTFTLDEIISYDVQAIHPLSLYDAVDDLKEGDRVIINCGVSGVKVCTVRGTDYTDETFTVVEDGEFCWYTVDACIGKLIPLADYLIEDTKPKQQQTVTTKLPTLEYIKNNPVDIPQPKFALYAADDQDVINFIKQKEKLYTFDSDGTLMELLIDEEIIFLIDHYEENELYVLKPY